MCSDKLSSSFAGEPSSSNKPSSLTFHRSTFAIDADMLSPDVLRTSLVIRPFMQGHEEPQGSIISSSPPFSPRKDDDRETYPLEEVVPPLTPEEQRGPNLEIEEADQLLQRDISPKLFAHIHSDAIIRDTQFEGGSTEENARFLDALLSVLPQELDPLLLASIKRELGQISQYAQALSSLLGRPPHETAHLSRRMVQDIAQLNVGESITIRGGWTKWGKNNSHAMLYKIKREPDAADTTKRFSFIIFNTGAGIQYHQMGKSSVKQKFSPVTCYANIPAPLLSDDFLYTLLREVTQPTSELGIQSQKIYGTIHNHLHAYHKHSHLLQELITAQKSGVCSMKVVLAALRMQCLDHYQDQNAAVAAYKRIIFAMKFFTLKKFFKAKKVLLESTSVQGAQARKLVIEAAEKLMLSFKKSSYFSLDTFKTIRYIFEATRDIDASIRQKTREQELTFQISPAAQATKKIAFGRGPRSLPSAVDIKTEALYVPKDCNNIHDFSQSVKHCIGRVKQFIREGNVEKVKSQINLFMESFPIPKKGVPFWDMFSGKSDTQLRPIMEDLVSLQNIYISFFQEIDSFCLPHEKTTALSLFACVHFLASTVEKTHGNGYKFSEYYQLNGLLENEAHNPQTLFFAKKDLDRRNELYAYFASIRKIRNSFSDYVTTKFAISETEVKTYMPLHWAFVQSNHTTLSTGQYNRNTSFRWDLESCSDEKVWMCMELFNADPKNSGFNVFSNLSYIHPLHQSSVLLRSLFRTEGRLKVTENHARGERSCSTQFQVHTKQGAGNRGVLFALNCHYDHVKGNTTNRLEDPRHLNQYSAIPSHSIDGDASFSDQLGRFATHLPQMNRLTNTIIDKRKNGVKVFSHLFQKPEEMQNIEEVEKALAVYSSIEDRLRLSDLIFLFSKYPQLAHKKEHQHFFIEQFYKNVTNPALLEITSEALPYSPIWRTPSFKAAFIEFLKKGKETVLLQKAIKGDEQTSVLSFYARVARMLLPYAQEENDPAFIKELEHHCIQDINEWLYSPDLNLSRENKSVLHQERLMFYRQFPKDHFPLDDLPLIVESYLHTILHPIGDLYKERHIDRMIEHFIGDLFSSLSEEQMQRLTPSLSTILERIGLEMGEPIGWQQIQRIPHCFTGGDWTVNLFSGEISRGGELISFPFSESAVYEHATYKELFGDNRLPFIRKNGFICFEDGAFEFRFPYKDADLQFLSYKRKSDPDWQRFIPKAALIKKLEEKRKNISDFPLFETMISDHHWFVDEEDHYFVTDTSFHPKYRIRDTDIQSIEEDPSTILQLDDLSLPLTTRIEEKEYVYIKQNQEKTALIFPRYNNHGNPLSFILNKHSNEYELETNRNLVLSTKIVEGTLGRFDNFLILRDKKDGKQFCLIPHLEYCRELEEDVQNDFDLIDGQPLDIQRLNVKKAPNYDQVEDSKKMHLLSRTFSLFPLEDDKLTAKTTEEHLFLAYLFLGQKNYQEAIHHLKSIDPFDMHSQEALDWLSRIIEFPLSNNACDATAVKMYASFIKVTFDEQSTLTDIKDTVDPFDLITIVETYIAERKRIKKDLSLTAPQITYMIETLLNFTRERLQNGKMEEEEKRLFHNAHHNEHHHQEIETRYERLQTLMQAFKGKVFEDILSDEQRLQSTQHRIPISEYFGDSTFDFHLDIRLPQDMKNFGPGRPTEEIRFDGAKTWLTTHNISHELQTTTFGYNPNIFWKLYMLVTHLDSLNEYEKKHLEFVLHSSIRCSSSDASKQNKILVELLAVILSKKRAHAFPSYIDWEKNPSLPDSLSHLAITTSSWMEHLLYYYGISLETTITIDTNQIHHLESDRGHTKIEERSDQIELSLEDPAYSESLPIHLDPKELQVTPYLEQVEGIKETIPSEKHQEPDFSSDLQRNLESFPESDTIAFKRDLSLFLEGYQEAHATKLSPLELSNDRLKLRNMDLAVNTSLDKIKEEYSTTKLLLLKSANRSVGDVIWTGELVRGKQKPIQFSDLVYLFIHRKKEFYRERNPHLTDADIDSLIQETAKCLYMGIKQKQLQLMQKSLKVILDDESTEKIRNEELTNLETIYQQQTPIAEYIQEPKLLAFEYNMGILFRKSPDQIDAIKTMIRKDHANTYLNSVYQMPMGGGKTSVLIANLLAECDGIPILVTPRFQFPTIYEQIKQTLKKCFNMRVVKFDYSREELTPRVLKYIRRTLLSTLDNTKRQTKTALVICPEMLQTLSLEFLSMQYNLNNQKTCSPENYEKLQLLSEILNLFKHHGNAIGDEVQTLFDINKETTFSLGDPQGIEPDYLNLLKMIYTIIAKETVVVPKSLLSIEDQENARDDGQGNCEIGIEKLLRLKENKQAYFSVDNFKKYIIPKIAFVLAKRYPPLKMQLESQEMQEKFIRYVSGQMEGDVQRAASGNVEILRQLQKPDHELDERHLAMKRDLGFLQNLTQLKSSDEEKDQLAAQLRALTKHLLMDVLSSTLTKTCNLRYGRTKNPKAPGQVKPYQCAGTESTTEFGYHYEAASYHFATALYGGISRDQIKGFAEDLHRNAVWFMHNRDIKYEDSPPAKTCLDLFGKLPFEVLETIPEIQESVNQDIDKLLAIEAKTIDKFVHYFPLRVTSTPHDLMRIVRSFRATGGTLYKDVLPIPMMENTKEDNTVNQKVLHTLLKKASKDTVKVLPKETKELSEIFDYFLENHSEKQNICALLDAGGVFKDFDPNELGPTLFTLLEKKNKAKIETFIRNLSDVPRRGILFRMLEENKDLKEVLNQENVEERAIFDLISSLKTSVLFFSRSPSGTTADHFTLIQKGDPTPKILEDTSKATLAKYGVKPEETLSIYDQRHCLGTDIPQPSNGIAIMTFSKNTSRDLACQAIMRLRGFFDGQTISLMIPEEDARKISTNQKAPGEEEKFLSLLDLYQRDHSSVESQIPLIYSIIFAMHQSQIQMETTDIYKSYKKALFDVIFQAGLTLLLDAWKEEKNPKQPQESEEEYKDRLLNRNVQIVDHFFSSLYLSTEDNPFALFGSLQEDVETTKSLENYSKMLLTKIATALEDSSSCNKDEILASCQEAHTFILNQANKESIKNHMVDKVSEMVLTSPNNTSEAGVELQVARVQESQVEKELSLTLLQELEGYRFSGPLTAKEDWRTLPAFTATLNKWVRGEDLPLSLKDRLKEGYKQPYDALFDEDLLISDSCYQPYRNDVSIFERRPPFNYLLYMRLANGQTKAVLISQREADLFKQNPQENISLVNPNGIVEAGTPIDDLGREPNLKKLLIQMNVLTPYADYLVKHPKEYHDWLTKPKELIETKKSFLKLRAEYFPLEKPHVYEYLIRPDILERIIKDEKELLRSEKKLDQLTLNPQDPSDIPLLTNEDMIRSVPNEHVHRLEAGQIRHIKKEQAPYVKGVEQIGQIPDIILESLTYQDFQPLEPNIRDWFKKLKKEQCPHIKDLNLLEFLPIHGVSEIDPHATPYLRIDDIAQKVRLLSGKDHLKYLSYEQVQTLGNEQDLLQLLPSETFIHMSEEQLNLLSDDQYRAFTYQKHQSVIGDLNSTNLLKLDENVLREAFFESKIPKDKWIEEMVPKLGDFTTFIFLFDNREDLLTSLTPTQIQSVPASDSLEFFLRRMPKITFRHMTYDQIQNLSDDQIRLLDSPEDLSDWRYLRDRHMQLLDFSLIQELIKLEANSWIMAPGKLDTINQGIYNLLMDTPEGVIAHLREDIDRANGLSKRQIELIPTDCPLLHLLPVTTFDRLSDEQLLCLSHAQYQDKYFPIEQAKKLPKEIKTQLHPDVIRILLQEAIREINDIQTLEAFYQEQGDSIFDLLDEIQISFIPSDHPFIQKLPPHTFKWMNQQQLNHLDSNQYCQIEFGDLAMQNRDILTSINAIKGARATRPEIMETLGQEQINLINLDPLLSEVKGPCFQYLSDLQINQLTENQLRDRFFTIEMAEKLQPGREPILRRVRPDLFETVYVRRISNARDPDVFAELASRCNFDILSILDQDQVRLIPPEHRVFEQLPFNRIPLMNENQLNRLSGRYYNAQEFGIKEARKILPTNWHKLRPSLLNNLIGENRNRAFSLTPACIPHLDDDRIRLLVENNQIPLLRDLSREQVERFGVDPIIYYFPENLFVLMTREQLNALSFEQYQEFNQTHLGIVHLLNFERTNLLPPALISTLTDPSIIDKLSGENLILLNDPNLIRARLSRLDPDPLTGYCHQHPPLMRYLNQNSVKNLTHVDVLRLLLRERPDLLPHLSDRQVREIVGLDAEILHRLDLRVTMSDLQLNALSDAQYQNFTLPLTELRRLQKKNIAKVVQALPLDRISDLTQEELQYLSKQQVEALGDKDIKLIQRLPTSLYPFLTKEQLEKLSSAQIGQIRDSAMIAKLSSFQLSHLPSDLVNLISDDKIRYLRSKEKCSRLKFSKLLMVEPNQLSYCSFMQKTAYFVATLAFAILSTITILGVELLYWTSRICKLTLLQGVHKSTLNSIRRMAKLTAHFFTCCPRAPGIGQPPVAVGA